MKVEVRAVDLKAMREKRALTQRKLAHDLGISQTYIPAIEAERAMPGSSSGPPRHAPMEHPDKPTRPLRMPRWTQGCGGSAANGAKNGCKAAGGLRGGALQAPKSNSKKQCLHQDSNPGPTD